MAQTTSRCEARGNPEQLPEWHGFARDGWSRALPKHRRGFQTSRPLTSSFAKSTTPDHPTLQNSQPSRTAHQHRTSSRPWAPSLVPWCVNRTLASHPLQASSPTVAIPRAERSRLDLIARYAVHSKPQLVAQDSLPSGTRRCLPEIPAKPPSPPKCRASDVRRHFAGQSGQRVIICKPLRRVGTRRAQDDSRAIAIAVGRSPYRRNLVSHAFLPEPLFPQDHGLRDFSPR